jgi:hypothetical protein
MTEDEVNAAWTELHDAAMALAGAAWDRKPEDLWRLKDAVRVPVSQRRWFLTAAGLEALKPYQDAAKRYEAKS